MNFQERLNAFLRLGDKLRSLSKTDISDLSTMAVQQNGWFVKASVEKSIHGITLMLEKEKLQKWLSSYDLNADGPKIVGIIMAGNIPLVGFHDLMCVLVSGNIANIKMSSQDQVLMNKVIQWLCEVEPRFKRNIVIKEKLDAVDAVICTGSDNTARYFEYYFGKYPHIIRKNRTSVAVLEGNESHDELKALGEDIFSYFGLGCRNVSKLFAPTGFDFKSILPHLEGYKEVINHNKYRNNYDYNKAIYLVNKETHLDSGFLLLRETEDLVSPTSVLYTTQYETDGIESALALHSDKIQCVIGHNYVPFGKAQYPEPWDYADGVDVMSFLDGLNRSTD